MTFIPILVFWVLLLVGLLARGPFLVYLLFGSMSFGSLAVIPPELTQGLSLTPPPIIALAIMLKYLGAPNGVSRALYIALSPSHGLLLFLFWVIALWTTLFMPRIFAGTVTVIPLKIENYVTGQPLQVTSQNLSQMVYLTISILTVFVCALIFRPPAMRQHVLAAICFGGGVLVVTGVLDLAGLSPFLDIFRTANYSYLTDVEISNVKRITGLMPEASSYGSSAVGFLAAIYFYRRAIVSKRLRVYGAPFLVILLALFSFLSTSSTAYVGLSLFAFMALCEWLWRGFMLEKRSPMREGLLSEFWIVVGGLCIIYLTALTAPSLFRPFLDLVDTIIFQKASSDSYAERSMWTAVSLSALWETWGLGVGLGSTRASNGVVAIFSNTGILGGVLYYTFLVQTVLRAPAPDDQIGAAILNAVRFYLPVVFIMGVLSGTTADFGVLNASIFGLACATAAGSMTTASPRPSEGLSNVGS